MRRWGLEIYVWQLKYKELERQEGNERQCTQLLKCKIWLSNLEIIDQYIHLDEGNLNTQSHIEQQYQQTNKNMPNLYKGQQILHCCQDGLCGTSSDILQTAKHLS